MKKQIILKNVCGVLCFLSFMFLIGSVGAVEHNNITLGQGLLQSVISLTVFAAAAYTGGFMK